MRSATKVYLRGSYRNREERLSSYLALAVWDKINLRRKKEFVIGRCVVQRNPLALRGFEVNETENELSLAVA